MSLPAILEPLRHRDFRLLWIGQTFSRLGDSAYAVALPLQVLAIGGSPLQLGIVFSLSSVSRIALLLVGGSMVDRLPRRLVLIATDLSQGAIVAVVAILGFTGQLQVEHLYITAVLFGASSAFFTPAIGAIIPELVPADILIGGNALRGFSRQAGMIVGPVIAGLLIALSGPPAAFAFDAATFGVSLIALLFIASAPAAATRAGSSLLAEIKEGWSYTFSVPWLWITIFGFALINGAVYGPILIGLPILVVDELRADQSVYGLLVAAMGVGEVLGAVVTAQLRRGRNGTVMYLYVLAEGLAVALFATLAPIPVLLLLAGVVGYCVMGFTILWESAIQQHVPRELLGRVTSIDYFGAILIGPITPIVAALLVVAIGPAMLFLWGGLIASVLCLAAIAVPSIRQLRIA
ncbi:MAG TPA: MFS transporter [Candidatus Limnocylindria bacterium]|nr:MFS transporter [Candidatus Limnocylindria bacterium]